MDHHALNVFLDEGARALGPPLASVARRFAGQGSTFRGWTRRGGRAASVSRAACAPSSRDSSRSSSASHPRTRAVALLHEPLDAFEALVDLV